MRSPSPYRSLPAETRVRLVMHAIRASPASRASYVARLVSRGGGFRAVTLSAWPVERLAKEVVRLNVESAHDELELLQLLYVDLEPAIQSTFLDAAGVTHDNGKIADDLDAPYADVAAVKAGAEAVVSAHGPDGRRYLSTIARYGASAWPGIVDFNTEAGIES